MAQVRIKVRPTGLINGRTWPQVGEVFELADAAAEVMAKAGNVEVLPAEPKVETRPAAKRGVEKRSEK